MNSISNATSRWHLAGLNLVHGWPEQKIRASFEAIGQAAPADVVRLYSACAGMLPFGTVDDEWFCLWPLDYALGEYSKSPTKFFGFGEGFLSAHRYSFVLKSDPCTAVFADSFDGKGSVVADSIDDFFRHLEMNPQKIWLP